MSGVVCIYRWIYSYTFATGPRAMGAWKNGANTQAVEVLVLSDRLGGRRTRRASYSKFKLFGFSKFSLCFCFVNGVCFFLRLALLTMDLRNEVLSKTFLLEHVVKKKDNFFL